jgi:GTP-binding protein
VKIQASFVTSVASASGFPKEALAELAFVGRSNVGKSSLINALVRQRIARTAAAPGKTRLVNVYRVARPSTGSGRAGAAPFYLLDLPGYGFARGGSAGFDELVLAAFARSPAALLLVDIRHPGLESDRAAWEWVSGAAADAAVVATKIDKLARGERIRATRQLESVFDASVLPVSAVTGEGLDELWNLIDSLVNRRNRNHPPRHNSPRPPKPTARSQGQPQTRPPRRQKK